MITDGEYAQSRVAGGDRQMAKVAGCDPGCEQLIRDDNECLQAIEHFHWSNVHSTTQVD